MTEILIYSESELAAFNYRQLQTLTKRADIQSWRPIRLNSSASQLVSHLLEYFSQLKSSTVFSTENQTGSEQLSIDQQCDPKKPALSSQETHQANALDLSMVVPVMTQQQLVAAVVPSKTGVKAASAVIVNSAEVPNKSVTGAPSKQVAVKAVGPKSEATHRRAKSAASTKPSTTHDRKGSHPLLASQTANHPDVSKAPVSKPTAAARARQALSKAPLRTSSAKPQTMASSSQRSKVAEVSTQASCVPSFRAPTAQKSIKTTQQKSKTVLPVAAQQVTAGADQQKKRKQVSATEHSGLTKKPKTESSPSQVTASTVTGATHIPSVQPSSYDSLMNELNERVSAAKAAGPPQVSRPPQATQPRSSAETVASSSAKPKSHKSMSMKEKFEASHRRLQQN